MTKVLIGLGSNSGDRAQNLDRAVGKLRALPETQVLAVSSWHETKPAGGPSADDYLNGAVTLQTALDSVVLLLELQRIEDELGRVRNVRWGPRTIDLDLLLYDEFQIETTDVCLKVPHPRMAYRRFVLEPACEIAADWIYPINDSTLKQLLARMDSTPRRIAVVGMQNEFAAVATDVSRRFPQWELATEWGPDEMLRLVIVAGSGEFSEWSRRAKLRGSPPVLISPNHSAAWVTEEILGAIAAMD